MVKNILIGLSLVFSVSAFVISLKLGANKTVYIDTGRVYDEFILSKESNKEVENIFRTRKNILDSLAAILKYQNQVLSENVKRAPSEILNFRQREQEYLFKEKQFERENKMLMSSSEEKIWKRINQYVENYGRENGYSFVLGANGQGNIMFGDKENDVTNEVVKYINERYEGQIK